MQQQFSENLFCEVNNISDNWVVSNLENALGTWNEKLAELWQLITQTPQSFKGGQIWSVIVGINSALQGIGYGLLVLFFAMGVFGAATDRRELANLLHISDTQLGYITDAEPGHGLLRMGGVLVPFSKVIPKDTDLYCLMNTSPGQSR